MAANGRPLLGRAVAPARVGPRPIELVIGLTASDWRVLAIALALARSDVLGFGMTDRAQEIRAVQENLSRQCPIVEWLSR